MIDFTPDELMFQLFNYISQSGKNGVTQKEIDSYFSSIASPDAMRTVQNDLVDQNAIIFFSSKWRTYSDAEKAEEAEALSPALNNWVKVGIPIIMSAAVAMYVVANFMVFTS